MKTLGHITKEKTGYKVVFKRTYDHPIEKVWEAITDPEQLKYWFAHIEMDFRTGGEIIFRFDDKDQSLSYGKIVSINKPYGFVWTWENELAEWELEKTGAHQTQLTLTYSRLSNEYALRAPAGFHDLLDQLEDRLNGSEEIHKLGSETDGPGKTYIHYAAATYGAFPELVKEAPVVVERTYDASVKRVWKALTDKEQMKEWYFTLDDFIPEKGFHFSFRGQGHKGEQYVHHCIITEMIPYKKLQYSWAYENYKGYSLVTFELFEEGEQTRVKLTHHGLETFPQNNADFARSSFNGGWTELIGNSLPKFLSEK